MAYKIYLSPSNQGGNKYASGNTNEMAQCDKIAAAAKKALTRCGFSVMVGKSGDTMQNRCKESDAFGADIHMPIHTNAFDGKTTGGTLVYVIKLDAKHVKAGNALLGAVGKITIGKDYTLRTRTDLYEINTPKAMTLYLEVEFHDTKTGSDWIRNNITNIGEAIAKGLCKYFGVAYKSPNTKPKDTETSNDKEVTMYYVQTGAFTSKANAENMVKDLKAKGFDAIVKTEVKKK